MSDLKSRLLGSVEVVNNSTEFSEDDFRWGETKFGDRGGAFSKPKVYINHEKYKSAGAKNYEDQAIFGESLHNLKTIEPDRYERMEKAALSDPDYFDWAQDAYRRSVEDPKIRERRNFWQWHRDSRFDQVIGGCLFGSTTPGGEEWPRDKMRWGPALRGELEKLATDLGVE